MPLFLHHRRLLFSTAVFYAIVTHYSVAAMATQTNANSSQRIALVTGGNKGIGKEIVRLLSQTHGDSDKQGGGEDNSYSWTILVGSRDKARGDTAVKELKQNLPTSDTTTRFVCCPLDLTKPESIQEVFELVKKESCLDEGDDEGRLDVLINNAAICFNDPTLYGSVSHTPFEKQADITIRTNFFGTLEVTQTMLPLLKRSPNTPRIINIASAAGRLAILKGRPDLVQTVTSPDLKLSTLEDIMRDFVRDVEAGTHASKGWPNTCYGISKLGVIAMTKIFAREYDDGSPIRIMINSVDPGYCATDQNNNQGVLPAERGAVTPVLLATTKDFITGRHLFQEQEIGW